MYGLQCIQTHIKNTYVLSMIQEISPAINIWRQRADISGDPNIMAV